MIVTVIIPVFNRASMVARAIRSVLDQNYAAKLDVLVVDDGSTDETPQVVDALAAENAVIRVIRHENRGIAPARNTGLHNLLPETEIVTFLDSDDLMVPNRLFADLAVLAAREDLDYTYGRMIMTDQFDTAFRAPAAGARTADIASIHLSAGLFRRRLIERTGLFDEEMIQAEDTDYLMRIFESGAEFVQTDTPCIYYFKHRSNISNDQDVSRRFFAVALRKSMLRRRAQPTGRLNKPVFDVQALRDAVLT